MCIVLGHVESQYAGVIPCFNLLISYKYQLNIALSLPNSFFPWEVFLLSLKLMSIKNNLIFS